MHRHFKEDKLYGAFSHRVTTPIYHYTGCNDKFGFPEHPENPLDNFLQAIVERNFKTSGQIKGLYWSHDHLSKDIRILKTARVA